MVGDHAGAAGWRPFFLVGLVAKTVAHPHQPISAHAEHTDHGAIAHLSHGPPITGKVGEMHVVDVDDDVAPFESYPCGRRTPRNTVHAVAAEIAIKTSVVAEHTPATAARVTAARHTDERTFKAQTGLTGVAVGNQGEQQ